MSKLTFEWNASKASINKNKHGISFEEAKSVFLDDNAAVIHDPEHSEDEDRFVILGLSTIARLLVVVIVIEKMTASSELSLPGRQQKMNQCNIMEVEYEKRV